MLSFRIFPDGTVAWFVEAPGGGAKLDINADRNRPAKSPEDWFENIKYHVALDLMEVAFEGSKEISHGSVASASSLSGTLNSSSSFAWNTGSASHLLFTHNLGYEPDAIVAVGDMVLEQGMPVQTNVNGGARYVSYHVTATELRIVETFSSGSTTLAADNIEYSFLIFRAPPAPVGNKAFDFDPETGNTQMGQKRFDLERKYLQAAPGGSPFSLSYGRRVDLKNGGIRFVLPDGSYYEPVPSMYTYFAPGYGSGSPATIGYNGSYAGGDTLLVQAP